MTTMSKMTMSTEMTMEMVMAMAMTLPETKEKSFFIKNFNDFLSICAR